MSSGVATDGRRRSVAVIGAGVAGLTAAYVLQQEYDVTLYESEDRLGGHAHTHDVVTPDASSIPVDSGFIVYNDKTYPLLRRLFRELGVEGAPSEMSMSVRCDGCGLEYAGARGAGGVFAQWRSGLRPAFLWMMVEVERFHRQARALLAGGDDQPTLGEFLRRRRYSPYFVRHFVIPLVSCVWSAASGVALEYPARYLFVFLDNHGLLTVTGSPQWRTVVGGSRTYVERISKNLHAQAIATPVRTVIRHGDRVEIRDDADQAAPFDRVVLATHADTSLRLLEHPTPDERSALGAFSYSRNETCLHSDPALLPTAARARASWNYLLPRCDAESTTVLVSYDMNRLQSLPTRTPYLVSLNAGERIDPGRVVARMTYEHPIYTRKSVAAQLRLPALNHGTTAFAGAYHGWGFHEDGCRSGVEAAASFGVSW
jgi:uncharacterized protein